jgi:hypothetical protein
MVPPRGFEPLTYGLGKTVSPIKASTRTMSGWVGEIERRNSPVISGRTEKENPHLE